jgi:glycosyltransferase involved in cell wall biosynthesis
MRLGNEDWAFWLRLGGKGLYGLHLGKVLFRYRKAGPSLGDVAARHQREAVAHMREEHPELFCGEGCARVKRKWAPAACVVGGAKPEILDCEAVEPAQPAEILRRTRARAFLIPGVAPHPQSAELAALAVWAGNARLRLPDGSLAASREALSRVHELSELRPERALGRSAPAAPPRLPSALATAHRHLYNAGLLSAEAWLKHPLRSALRLIPLRVKEGVNRRAGRAVFDLSFYLQFQPSSILLGRSLLEPLQYLPPEPSRRRIALITPHLGPGGAERVLLDIAAALRGNYEIFLIATQSSDSRWRQLWEESAARVYDLAALAPPERVPGALYSILTNWKIGAALIQNSLPAYSIVRELKAALPELKIADLVHSADAEWDFISSTEAVAGALDARVVISEAARVRMLEAGTPEEKIRLIPNGLDLARFESGALPPGPPHRILFAGRLDPVKRPLLLVDIAVALRALRPQADFQFVVAGDGPEAGALRARIERAGLAARFEMLGHVPDVAPLLADATLLVLTSRAEGIPLAVLEAFAARRPVVASDAGAVREVVDASTGIVIPDGDETAAAFAKAIDALLNAPELRARMGEEGRRKVEARYGRERFCQAYRELFRSL